ncbi:hypothetical protein BASA83_004668 [Batrachochytrium salamandrivorans]|nr:hypothetical protein BASA83_004668 [Batrachochytrium salamandrivorans]
MNSSPQRTVLHIARHADMTQPLQWQVKDKLSQKCGPHATVYLINGDRYIGDWKDNKRHGKGMQFYKQSGNVYEGEWENDQRHGFGTLSIPITATLSINDMGSIQPRSSTRSSAALPGDSMFASSSSKKPTVDDTRVGLRKVYAGAWEKDKRHGVGTFFYDAGNVYEGSWVSNQREGWGRMMYADQSVYEGEWHAEHRHGQGILQLANGDRYEGMWLQNEKEGPGKFIYRTKRQIYEGEWTMGMPKCGALKDLPPLPGQQARLHPLPPVMLSDPAEILNTERQQIYTERMQRMMGDP